MNKLTLPVLFFVMLFTAGCATTGESYTDEGTRNPSVDASASTQSDLTDPSAALPEIAAYDEPEIPSIDTSMNDGEMSGSSSADASDLPEIAAYDEPEIPALDAPATE